MVDGVRANVLEEVIEKYDISRVINQHMEMFNNLISEGVILSLLVTLKKEVSSEKKTNVVSLLNQERRVAA